MIPAFIDGQLELCLLVATDYAEEKAIPTEAVVSALLEILHRKNLSPEQGRVYVPFSDLGMLRNSWGSVAPVREAKIYQKISSAKSLATSAQNRQGRDGHDRKAGVLEFALLPVKEHHRIDGKWSFVDLAEAKPQ